MWLKFHMAHRFVAEKCHWINLINSITLDLTWNVKNSSHLSPCFITDFFINTAMPIYLRNHTKVQYFDWYWSTLRFSNGGICPSIILWKKYVMTTKRDGKWFFWYVFPSQRKSSKARNSPERFLPAPNVFPGYMMGFRQKVDFNWIIFLDD